MIPIRGTTRVLGVFGDPVEHTLSPSMHNRALAHLGLDYVYVPFHVRPPHLREAVRGVRALGITGVNVTIPHKVAMLEHLDALDPGARLSGAVNTVHNQDGRLVGYNTDGPGFVRSLQEEAGVDPAGKRFVIVGAGGAARAIAVQLALSGAAHIAIVNRTVKNAEVLLEVVRQAVAEAAHVGGDQLGTHAQVVEWADAKGLAQVFAEGRVVINTTSVGMAPKSDVPSVVPPELLHPGQLVCDIVYVPQETSLLKAAKARGCQVLEGLGMLAYQGAIAFEYFTGQVAPVELMRQTLAEALAARTQ